MDDKKIRSKIASKLLESVRVSAPADVKSLIPAVDAASAKTTKIKSVINAYRKSTYSKISRGQFNNGFEAYDYNMAEVTQAEDAEGYVSISFDKHIDTCTKADFTVASQLEAASKHVEDRLFEVFTNTGKGIDEILHAVIRDLVKYSNAYLVFVRDEDRTNSSPYRYGGKRVEPIAGIFIADPPSMRVKRNKKGVPLRYQQYHGDAGRYSFSENTSSDKTFKAEDVLHLTFNKKEGHAYGTPFIVPALEDIRSLRRIEEMVEMLVAGHIFPLFHYIVGDEHLPGTQEEVDIVQKNVEEMPTEGSLVTTERHKIVAVGAASKALDAKPYLEYFEKRVLATLRISEITIGRGDTANKNTADSIDKVLIDRCNYYLREISKQISNRLFVEFLLDGKLPLNRKTYCKLKFDELNAEETRAVENHNMALYQGSVITKSQLIQRLEMPEEKPGDADDMYNAKVTIPMAEATAKLAKQYAVPTGQGSDPAKSSKNSTKSKTQPSNQHGTKTTKTKVTANSLSDSIAREICSLRETLSAAPELGYNEFFAEACLADTVNRITVYAIQHDNVLNENHKLDQEKRLSIIPKYIKESVGDEVSMIRKHLTTGKTEDIGVLLDRFKERAKGIADKIDADYIEEPNDNDKENNNV